MDWSNYASVYDLMASNNPAYSGIVASVLDDFSKLDLPMNSIVADIGAGTGNIYLPLASSHRQFKILHVDSNSKMLELARHKSSQMKISNIEFIESDSTEFIERNSKLNAIVLIHSLYSMEEPKNLLKKLYTNIEQGGYLVVCDLGRPLRIVDWAMYLFLEMAKNNGLWYAIKSFYLGRHIASYNRVISHRQLSGEYWTHTQQEFHAVVEGAGFKILRSELMYRGYSDYVFAKKI